MAIVAPDNIKLIFPDWDDYSAEKQQKILSAKARAQASAPRDYRAGCVTALGTTPYFGKRCRENPGPPCWPLVYNAYDVFLDKATWPTHVCELVMHETLRNWARTNLKTLTTMQRAQLTNFSPMPVGKRALMGRAALYDDEMRLACSRAIPYMSIEDDELAAVIIRAEHPSGKAKSVMYGLVEEIDGSLHAGDMLPDSFGTESDCDDMRAWRRNVQEWWHPSRQDIADRIPRGGRRHTIDSLEEIMESLHEFRSTIEFEPEYPRVLNKDFVVFLGLRVGGLTEATLDNSLKRFKTSWRSILKA